MAKKGSVIKRGLAKRELKKRTKEIGNPRKKIAYLERVLGTKSHLSKDTQDAAHLLLGDLYSEQARPDSVNFIAKDMAEAIRNYSRGGKVQKAKGLLEKNAYELGGEIKSLEFDIVSGQKGEKGALHLRKYVGYSSIALISGLLFLSPVVTGNAVAGLSSNTSTGLGSALIVLGLLVAYCLKSD